MLRYDYVRPASVEEACAFLLKTPGRSCPIAGCTDFLVQVREKSARWKDLQYVVDLSALPELSGIRVEDGIVHVGAMTTHSAAEHSPVLAEHAPLLAAACASVGSPQIRNRGTIGGAVANASPASDPMPVLIALEANALVQGPNGQRTIPMSDMIVKPGKTALAPDEIILGFSFPSVAHMRTVFLKLGRRKALSISRMNVSLVVHQDAEGVIDHVALAPGCVFAAPDRARKAEALLLGRRPDAALIDDAAKAVADEMIERTGVRWSTEYKQPVITALVRRALENGTEVAE
ncbi:xanthine dehydrogenase family protein subunit M [Pseudoflavonifractor sp. MSJ-37]|uniref:FAD binding domain-containing protein n=1 Tax=Pseudoflavonifractor sp. MSJ-37 TaxID=2841531 RepID=UPI001C116A85|nr:xanthine dehydrogenase family protein subunit M [Pseudoflavonifractor sp. MSJ-37]MBU5434656.1 xanthine dehydrogenase family protein subunit M [Pseudoflavonifractor sp. MSJ-37]